MMTRRQGNRIRAKVLVVEDEAPLAELLRYNLEAEGFRVAHAATGEEALDPSRGGAPGSGGARLDAARRLGHRGVPAPALAAGDAQRLPIIMLTARGEESDRMRGLSTGADDYVVKPFSMPELMARVRRMLRRATPDALAEVLKIGDIVLDRAAHRVTAACARCISARPSSACSSS